MARVQTWILRLVLLYGVLAFGMLARLYLLEPEEGIARFGVVVDGSPHSLTFLRTSLGAMFLGLSITAAYGMLRPAGQRAALTVLVLFMGCIVFARLYGIAADGATPTQWSELRAEGPSWLVFAAGLWIAVRAGARS